MLVSNHLNLGVYTHLIFMLNEVSSWLIIIDLNDQ